jgi:uncharacterized membrane protein
VNPLLFVLGVAAFTFANARAARIVSERWHIDAPAPSVGAILLVDAALLAVIAVLAGTWTVLAVWPLLAASTLVAVRWGSRPLRSARGERQSPGV